MQLERLLQERDAEFIRYKVSNLVSLRSQSKTPFAGGKGTRSGRINRKAAALGPGDDGHCPGESAKGIRK